MTSLEETPLADQSPDGVDLSMLEQLQRSSNGSGGDAGEPFGPRAGVARFESPEHPSADHVAIGRAHGALHTATLPLTSLSLAWAESSNPPCPLSAGQAVQLPPRMASTSAPWTACGISACKFRSDIPEMASNLHCALRRFFSPTATRSQPRKPFTALTSRTPASRTSATFPTLTTRSRMAQAVLTSHSLAWFWRCRW